MIIFKKNGGLRKQFKDKEISGKEFWSIWIKKKKVHLTPNGKYEKGIIALYGDCNNPEYLIKLI